MKLLLANPVTGQQKSLEIDDNNKLRPFFGKRMSTEVEGDCIGEEFKGYVLKIGGGNDKQGFPMKQGVLTNQRVRLLFKKGMSCFRERRAGCRKRKSVRGCIVDNDLSVMSLIVVRKGEQDIEGLTDETQPRRLGPKRANNIRKLFNLDKKDDVRKFVVRREVTTANGKKHSKAPKIQRLITPALLQRKRYFKSQQRQRMENGKKQKEEYQKRLTEYRAEQRDLRAQEVAKKKKGKTAE